MGKIEKAIQLLREDVPRGYWISIEVDTMVTGDAVQERADAVEFVGSVTKFLETAAIFQQRQMTGRRGRRGQQADA